MAVCFFFQAEDGIRDVAVTGVQTCALPISKIPLLQVDEIEVDEGGISALYGSSAMAGAIDLTTRRPSSALVDVEENGRASCRGRGENSGGAGSLKKKKKKTQSANTQSDTTA